MLEKFVISSDPDAKELSNMAECYRLILCSMFDNIIVRNQKLIDYPWIDCKINLLTGQDFSKDDPVKGTDAIYCWIQGRALEAISAYVQWAEESKLHICTLKGARAILEKIFNQLITVNSENHGHLFFLLNQKGRPFKLNSQKCREYISLNECSPYNFRHFLF